MSQTNKPLWYQEHPLKHAIERNPELHVPVRLFGDDTGTQKSKALRALLWNSATTRMVSRYSKIPIYLTQLKELILSMDVSESELQSATAYSFNVGDRMPYVDHNLEEWTGWRQKAAGELIAGGLVLTYCKTTGDGKFCVECFHLTTCYPACNLSSCHYARLSIFKTFITN